MGLDTVTYLTLLWISVWETLLTRPEMLETLLLILISLHLMD